MMKIYSSVISASLGLASSSSYYNVDIDNHADEDQAKLDSYYYGVKNTDETTVDGLAPIEVVITSPTKLITQKSGDSTLKTGDGIVPDFKINSKKLDQKIAGISKGGFDASGLMKEFPKDSKLGKEIEARKANADSKKVLKYNAAEEAILKELGYEKLDGEMKKGTDEEDKSGKGIGGKKK
jgi:hypothetical protein